MSNSMGCDNNHESTEEAMKRGSGRSPKLVRLGSCWMWSVRRNIFRCRSLENCWETLDQTAETMTSSI